MGGEGLGEGERAMGGEKGTDVILSVIKIYFKKDDDV